MLRYVLIAIFEQCALGMKLSRAVSLDNEDNHSSGIVCWNSVENLYFTLDFWFVGGSRTTLERTSRSIFRLDK